MPLAVLILLKLTSVLGTKMPCLTSVSSAVPPAMTFAVSLLAMRPQASSRVVGSTRSNRRIAGTSDLDVTHQDYITARKKYVSQSQAVSRIRLLTRHAGGCYEPSKRSHQPIT